MESNEIDEVKYLECVKKHSHWGFEKKKTVSQSLVEQTVWKDTNTNHSQSLLSKMKVWDLGLVGVESLRQGELMTPPLNVSP